MFSDDFRGKKSSSIRSNLLNNPGQIWRQSLINFANRYHNIILTDHLPSLQAAVHVNIKNFQ